MRHSYRFKQPVLGDYLNGRFVAVTEASGEWVARSPADRTDELGSFRYSYLSVEAAISAAQCAFAGWRATSVDERSRVLRKYRQGLSSREEMLVEVIAREIGKPIWDAKEEVRSALRAVDAVLDESLGFVRDFEVPLGEGEGAGFCRHRPLGVIAIVNSFDSPLHLPSADIAAALITGNAVVFKPSHRAPMSAQLLAEAFHEAEVPAGVFNLVQGERETGRRLCVHDQVDGVLFNGSYEVGMRIKQDTLLQHWKLLALGMGGKNAAIIWDDADFEAALKDVFVAAFSSAGQRYGAVSRVVVHRKHLDRFLERFHQRAKAFKISHPLENPFMGPLIDESAVDRYMKFQGIALREGCELIMRGKALELKFGGNYVAPSICWVQNPSLESSKKSVYQQTELFAPNIAVLAVDDIDEAIAQANASQYGLAASVYSGNQQIYEKCRNDLDMGVVNWNTAALNISARLPFGGLKKSGNHFVAGIFSARNCVHPISSTEVSDPSVYSQKDEISGLNWE